MTDDKKHTESDAKDAAPSVKPEVEPCSSNSTEIDLDNSFFGSYAHSLDGKGRIIIPVGYRKALGERFTIGPTRDFQGIALYPRQVWMDLLKEMHKLNQRKPVVQQYMNQFNKLSYPDGEADAQGRLLLPAKLRARMLSDAKDVEISGAFDHVRIVNNLKAVKEDEEFEENLTDILAIWGDLD